MAKKNFNELLQQKNKQTEQQQDVTELAKGMLSKKATGDLKETTIKLRITVKEKDLWQQKAKEQYNKSLSLFIRENVNYNIERGVTADDLLKK